VYLGVYAGFTFVFATGIFVRGYWFSRVLIRKAHEIHDKMFAAIIRAPMSFYDATPLGICWVSYTLGRVLSAFSKHLMAVDESLPDAGLQFLQYLPLGLGAMILAAVLIPFNFAPVIVILLLAGMFVRFTNPIIEKTKSLEAVTKGPVFAMATTSVEGLFSIRSYHAQTRFDSMQIDLIDDNHTAQLALSCSKSFQALYIDFAASLIVFSTSLLIAVYRDYANMPSIAGLALSNVLQMLVFVQWTVRNYVCTSLINST
jgi:ABC-type multidrug transport system fused ATPase/permease subunit